MLILIPFLINESGKISLSRFRVLEKNLSKDVKVSKSDILLKWTNKSRQHDVLGSLLKIEEN